MIYENSWGTKFNAPTGGGDDQRSYGGYTVTQDKHRQLLSWTSQFCVVSLLVHGRGQGKQSHRIAQTNEYMRKEPLFSAIKDDLVDYQSSETLTYRRKA